MVKLRGQKVLYDKDWEENQKQKNKARIIHDFTMGAMMENALSSSISRRNSWDFVERGEPIPDNKMPGRYLETWKRRNPEAAGDLKNVTDADFQCPDSFVRYFASPDFWKTRMFVMDRRKSNVDNF